MKLTQVGAAKQQLEIPLGVVADIPGKVDNSVPRLRNADAVGFQEALASWAGCSLHKPCGRAALASEVHSTHVRL